MITFHFSRACLSAMSPGSGDLPITVAPTCSERFCNLRINRKSLATARPSICGGARGRITKAGTCPRLARPSDFSARVSHRNSRGTSQPREDSKPLCSVASERHACTASKASVPCRSGGAERHRQESFHTPLQRHSGEARQHHQQRSHIPLRSRSGGQEGTARKDSIPLRRVALEWQKGIAR